MLTRRYYQVGIGVRLAVTSGMCEEKAGYSIPRSEKVHQSRLWWTLYSLDRYVVDFRKIKSRS